MRSNNGPLRRARILYIAVILAVVMSVAPQALPGVDVPTASAHNLQTKMVYMSFDQNTQAMLDARIAGPGWTPPTPLLQVGDQLGIVIKVVPRDGTATGVGGHVDFYVPNGTTVVDAAYLMPGDANPGDGISGYDKVPMKGQSLIAIGDGPIGAKSTSQLITLSAVGPNINGVTTDPVVPATGLHRGTIAGVYGDTGIFYSTDPDTAYGSWQRFSNPGNPGEQDRCGLVGTFTLGGAKSITNNSGDVFVPCNKWDAEQMYAWGVKGTTYTGPGAATAPIVDYGDGRGNSPWGFASGVGGPQSGYAWNFNWDEWAASAKTAADMRNAMGNDEIGPWKRIQYPGSRISKDQPGLTSTTLGIASIDGGSVGRAVSPSTPLPGTVSQTDTTSPKTIRWAVGQLTDLVPEFVWVKIKVDSVAAIVNTDGCPVFQADTFGGDAGGDSNGKDHLWRYYEPSRATWNGCLALAKPATKDVVKVGDNFQYKIKIYNAGTINDFTNVVVKDTLPAGVQFISAFPAQSSGPNPLVWIVPSLKRGEMWEATVTVKATGTGALENTLCVDAAGTNFDQCTADDTTSGSYPMLRQGKTASVTTVAPGANVQYTIQIDNIGSGPTGSPVTVLEYLPTGFTFVSKDLVTLNGANVTATTTANTGTPGQVLFTAPGALNAGQSLIIKFTANVPLGTPAGTYCDSYTTTQNGVPLTTGSLACITVGAGAIGDTIFRDWNGNGVQDIGDEGIAGVTVELQNGTCTPGSNCPTTTTDANGAYIFEGLAAGTYTVKITDLGPDGLPSSGDEVLTGYTQTLDPNGTCLPTPGAGCDGQSTVTLTTGQRNLNQDFGYKPGGVGQIGDTLWKDDGSGGGTAGNGVQDGTEPGIANVTVFLYEDTNGNGAIDPDDVLVATDVTDANGIYGFSGLAVDLNYLVKIDETDPDFTAVFTGPGSITPSTPPLQGAQPTTDQPSVLTVDFGYYQAPPAALGDTVCIDTNGDRLCTGVDTPLANIDVLLYGDTNGNGIYDPGEPLLAIDTTDANGIYGFSNLPAGPYVVVVDTNDPDLPGGLASTRNPQGVNLASGETNNDVDFPFVQRLTKTVRNVTSGQNPGANANPGDILEYKITPNYTGSNLLTSVKVTDTIPTGTTYVPASAAPAQTSGPDPLVWNLGSNTASVPGVSVFCPAEVSLDAQKDTHIAQNDGDENKNYGASATLETANETNKDIAGLLRFDLSSIPGGVTLESATLKLTVEGGQGANRQIEIHELLTSFTEGTGTSGGTVCTSAGNGASWGDTDGNDAGRGGPNCTDSWTPVDSFTSSNYGATNYGTIDPLTDEATYSVDVTSLVQSWLTTPSSNIGFAMIPAGSATNAVSWHSRESATAAKQPKLLVKYLVTQSGACAITTDGQAIFSVNANTPNYNAFNGATNTWGTAANAASLANKQRYLQIASGTTRNESIAMAVLDNSTVAGQFWNGASWNVIPNPPAGASGQLGTVSDKTFYSTDVAYESTSGDAVLVWDNNSQSVGNKLRFTTYDGATWGTPASIVAPTYSGAEPLYMVLASNPGTDGMVLAVNDLTFDDYAMVWDGSAWGNGLSLDTSGTATDDRTSLYADYEHSSGDAMVVYAKHNDAKVYYRIWNGTSWTAEASLNAPSGVTSQPQWLVLGSDPSTDRIALGVLTTNKTVWLSVWSGSAWGSTTTATTGAQTKDSPVVSVAFESLTGRALAVYGEGKNVRYRTWSSVSNAWTAELNGPVLADNAVTLLLDADPNSDEIMLSAMGSGKKVQASLWSNGWGALTQLSGNTNYNTGQPFDFHWQQNVLTQPSTRAALTTNRTLVTDTGGGVSIQVVLTVESSQAGTVTATALTVTGVGGAGATCGAATPAGAQPIAANGTLQFTYTCTVTAGSAVPGSVTFKTTPTAGGGVTGFVEATSNSVLATPPLVYRVTVNSPATVSEVDNTAQIGEGGGTIPPTTSNETQTIIPSGSIGDYVWYDNNGNGIQDGGELPVTQGAVLDLYQDTNANGQVDPGEPILAVTTANGSGFYSFPNLPPGNYVVYAEEQQVPAPPSSANAGQIGRMVTTTGNQAGRAITCTTSCTTWTDADFGFIEAASVEGTVFHDVNHNGLLDPGEPALPNVTVTLSGTDLNGNPVTLTTTTDANGEYFFVVTPGSYTITYNTADPDIPPGLTEATTPTSINLVAQAGVEYEDLNFGRDNAGRIGDRVWNDADGNGVQNAGEPGLASVTVYLCTSTPCNSGNAIATTATDSTGFYQFAGLPDGTYYVGVNQSTVPSGYTQTGYGDPGAPCGGSCIGQSPAVTVSGGATVSNVDFGYRPPLSGVYTVSGRVWDDQDGNGAQNGTEPGIPGVKVCLYDSTGTTVIACTTTNATGDYSFPGIANGTYVVKVDPTTLPSTAYYQTGDPDGAKDNQTTVTVNNANVTGKNFGYKQLLGSINGTVCDGTLPGNGDCTGGEPVVPGVPVFLTYAGTDGIIGTADDQVFTTTTDGSGNYSFSNLPPGNYQIITVPPVGKASLADADGGNPNNISVTLDFGPDGIPGNADDRMVKTNQDFELKPATGEIGDRVWLDTDGDGVQDVGEPGLPNVVVELKDGSGNPIDSDPNTPGVQPTVQLTDMNGNYLFTNVPPGSYQVDVVSGVPAGLATSPGTTDPRPVTLTAGQSYLDADFGYTAPAASAVIGDYVWADVNANGLQDPGEVGIGGVTVDLRGPGPDGILGTGDDTTVATVTTDPDGTYLFTGVTPGQYLVRVSGAPLTGYTPTTGPQSEGATTSLPVKVAAGDVLTDVDFGFDKPALYSISDVVWYDSNRDGVKNPGESGISGVTVNLLDTSGNVIATTTSAPDGSFTFPGVPNGSYTIQISDNLGALTDLQATTPSANAGQRPVVVSGGNVTGVNFGYAGYGPIGDTVFSDHNGNGVQDPGEPGIAGVQVKLYFDDGDGVYEPGTGDILIGTRTTDGSGNYLFNDLPPGTFWVSVDDTQAPLTGYTATTTDQDPATPNSTEYKVTLTPINPSFLGADFGYQKTSLADVSGTVWDDTNADAVQDPGEPGIPGVTVALVDSTGKVMATTTTDANGNYTFFDVPPGNYTVVVTDDANVLEGYTLTSGLDKIPVTVAATDVTDVDFGYVRNPATGAIGDTVWHDANRDGAQNGAEPGIANVTVRLYRDSDGTPGPSGGDTLVTTQVTDIYGQYLFTGLPAGNYYVDVDGGTLPSGLAPTPGTTDPSAVINLSAGQIYPDADFGYAAQTNAAIGDRIWHDVNGDGVQDPGEPGIGGVSIWVTPPAGVDIGNGPGSPVNVTTDPDGSWLLTGLPPGSYNVQVTPPAGYNPTPTNSSASVTIVMPASGQDVLYADFGFTAGPTGALGDTIFLDTNSNGVQDPGEPGIAGVTVSLLNNSNQVIATTVTNANGLYSFPGLPDGAYTVAVTDVNNVLAGLFQTHDPDQPGLCSTCDDQGTRTIVGGATDNTVDFGYAPVGGTIGNQVWHDKDGDGLYEPLGNDGLPNTADDEDGIQGVLIDLYLDTNNNGVLDPGVDNLVRTTTTDVNGQYQFTGLPAGKYLVDVVSSNFAAGSVLQGFVKTTGPTPGANNNSQADPYSVTLIAGPGGVVSSNDTADFGYDAPIPYSIAGTTFNDLNNNGPTVPTQEPGEPPITGVIVTLYRDLDGNGVIDPTDPVIGSTVSNASGDYLFTDLPPGNYLISTNALNTQANGTFQTTQTTTPEKGVQPVTITNADLVDKDFGFYRYPTTPLAVELAYFDGKFESPVVHLVWETVSEIDHLGFNVYRAESQDGPWTLLNGGLLPSPTPGSTQGHVYDFIDDKAPLGGTLSYRLEAVDVNLHAETVGEVSVKTDAVAPPPVVEEPGATQPPASK